MNTQLNTHIYIHIPIHQEVPSQENNHNIVLTSFKHCFNCTVLNYLLPSLLPLKYLTQIPLLPITFSYWVLVQTNLNSYFIPNAKPSVLPEWARLADGGLAWGTGGWSSSSHTLVLATYSPPYRPLLLETPSPRGCLSWCGPLPSSVAF